MRPADLLRLLRRSLLGEPPPYVRPAGRSLGRAMTCDTKYDLLKIELKRRGFKPEDGRLLQLKSYSADGVKKKFPLLPRHDAGIHIPYFDLSGRPTDFYRFRYFDAGPQRLR